MAPARRLLPCAFRRSHLNNKCDEATVREIIMDAVTIEQEFVCEALSVSLVGMNATLMRDYINYVADHLIVSLGYAKIYNATNPFDWMELISLQARPAGPLPTFRAAAWGRSTGTRSCLVARAAAGEDQLL